MNNTPEIETNGKARKIYFASDCHLGVPDAESSLIREKHFVKWLDEIKQDATEIYLLGDIFDFWFEYKTVVPRGYVRLLGKLAELTDSGIIIHYFTGNHDMWMFDYLTKELNIDVFRKPIVKEIFGKTFYVAHGDGLGRADYGYKLIKAIFANKICQWLFARLHPNFGMWLGLYFSKSSRVANGDTDEVFLGEEKERLIQYCKKKSEEEHFDYFIFGHRHLPLDIKISETSRYINLGEWVKSFSYAELSETGLELKFYKK